MIKWIVRTYIERRAHKLIDILQEIETVIEEKELSTEEYRKIANKKQRLVAKRDAYTTVLMDIMGLGD